MEATQGYCQGAAAKRQGKGWCQKAIQKITRFFVVVIKGTLYYSYVTAIAVCLLLGAASVYDIVVGDSVPPVVNYLSLYQQSVAFQTTNPLLAYNFKEEEAWDALKTPLQILDVVCPEASAWARHQHATGKLIWVPEPDGTYARYDYMTGKVYINRELFTLTDGERAVTIAHEFRHSRQNFSKFIKAAFAILITWRVQTEIVENDAYLYEAEVRRAIYRW